MDKNNYREVKLSDVSQKELMIIIIDQQKSIINALEKISENLVRPSGLLQIPCDGGDDY